MSLRGKLNLLSSLAFSVLIFACGTNEDASIPELSNTEVASVSEVTTEGTTENTPNEVLGESQQTEAISFGERILPIIESSCARCHTGDAPGTTHALLETASDVSAYAFAVAAVVEAGVMPPWPASNLSVPFEHDWSLSQQDREAVIQWARSGGGIDIEPSTKIAASEEVHHLADFDQEMFPIGNYDGEKGQSDEYRCFIYDPQLTERKYLVGYEFIPDQTEVVHHLVGYRVPKELRESADLKNFSDGQGGWSCFGGTGLGGSQIGTLNQMITLWGPGTGAVEIGRAHV